MEFPGGSDNYLAITGSSHPFLSGAETFHTPSLGDEEFEIPPIPLEADPSLAVVGTFEDLPEPGPAPYGVGGLELPGVGVGLPPGIMEQPGTLLNMELEPPIGSQFGPSAPVTIEVPLGALSPGALLATPLAAPLATPLTTIDQSELSSQLGLGLGGASATPPAPGPAPATPSPEGGVSPGPSPAGSLQEEEMEEFRRPPAAAPSPPVTPAVTPAVPSAPVAAPVTPAVPPEPPRRAKPPKKAKKKKDPNEPQKPVSAYALFFRDTQAAIKGQNPNATFGEVSKIVASMWDSLGEEQKQVYKRKTEAAKKEYLKALTAYKATLTSSEPPEPDPSPTPAPPPSSSSSSSPPPPSSPSPAPPPIAKILIPKTLLAPPPAQAPPQGGVASSPSGGGGVVAVIPLLPSPTPPPAKPRPLLPSPRLHPPPLQQMPPPPPPSGPAPPGGPAPSPPPAPPPLQAMQAPPPPPPKIRAPPPLQIKILPPLHLLPLPHPPATPNMAAATPTNAATPTAAAATPPGHAPRGEGPEEEEEEEMDGGEGRRQVESPPQVELVAGSPPPGPGSPRGRCVRAGCENAPVASQDWDEEFCSSECLVRHCRDVFLAWLASRGSASVVFVK